MVSTANLKISKFADFIGPLDSAPIWVRIMTI